MNLIDAVTYLEHDPDPFDDGPPVRRLKTPRLVSFIRGWARILISRRCRHCRRRLDRQERIAFGDLCAACEGDYNAHVWYGAYDEDGEFYD